LPGTDAAIFVGFSTKKFLATAPKKVMQETGRLNGRAFSGS
jgi:hypothetical protein